MNQTDRNVGGSQTVEKDSSHRSDDDLDRSPTPSRRRLLLIGVGVFVLAAILLTVVLGGGSGVAYGDEQILNAEEVLAEAEQVMQTAVAGGEGVAQDPARCYFSYPEASSTPNLLVRCGPVLFVGGDEAKPWMTVPVTFSPEVGPDGSMTGYRAEMQMSGASMGGLGSGEELRRPDGAGAPGEVTIAAPDPPPVARDYQAVTSDPVSIELDELDDARLIGVHYELEVRGSASVERATVDGEPVLAPDGARLVVAEVTGTRVGEAFGRPDVGLALEVDGTKQPLDGLELASSASASTTQTFVAVVPADAQDVLLHAGEPETNQAIDILSGERRGTAPEVLYRQRRSATVEETFRLPYSYDARYTDHPYGKHSTDVKVKGAELVWAHDGTTASAPDRALLVLTGVEVSSSQYAVPDSVPPERMQLTLDDGTTVVPDRMGSGRGTTAQFFGGNLTWEVPADFTEGTITIAPGAVTGSSDARFDYRDATASIDVRIPNG